MAGVVSSSRIPSVQLRFQRAVQSRENCAICGERKVVAMWHRRGKRSIRICLGCAEDGFWRELP